MSTVGQLAEEIERGLRRVHPKLRKTVIRKLAATVAAVLQTQTANTAAWAAVLPIGTERADMRLRMRERKQDQDGLYRRGDSPYWWASYTDARGTRVRRSTGVEERREAEALLAKWKLEKHRVRNWDEVPSRSFEELIVMYLKAT